MNEDTSIFERPEVLRLRGIQNTTFYLRPDEIYYIRADALKCYIMCEGCLYHVRHQMIQLEELLPEHFLKINRSVILNPDHIMAVYDDCVEFRDFSKLVITKGRVAWLREYFGITSS